LILFVTLILIRVIRVYPWSDFCQQNPTTDFTDNTDLHGFSDCLILICVTNVYQWLDCLSERLAEGHFVDSSVTLSPRGWVGSQRHRRDGCNVIVRCHNWPGCPKNLEVVELLVARM
jgi:hypothetical protein